MTQPHPSSSSFCSVTTPPPPLTAHPPLLLCVLRCDEGFPSSSPASNEPWAGPPPIFPPRGRRKGQLSSGAAPLPSPPPFPHLAQSVRKEGGGGGGRRRRRHHFPITPDAAREREATERRKGGGGYRFCPQPTDRGVPAVLRLGEKGQKKAGEKRSCPSI